MPDIFYIILTLCLLVTGGFVLWRIKRQEEKRRKEKEQMKHDYKMRRHITKREKERLKHEQKMTKQHRKYEKAKMGHDLHMNDKSNTADKLIEAIPETLKQVSKIVEPLGLGEGEDE